VGFFAVTAYTRLLTPAEYGVYVVGISIAAFWARSSSPGSSCRCRAIRRCRQGGFSRHGDGRLRADGRRHVRCDTIGLPVSQRRQCRAAARQHFVAIMANAVDVGQEFERAKLRPYRFAAISIVRSVASVGFGLLGIWLGWGEWACSRRSAWAR